MADFEFDRPRGGYERPDFPFRCGREAFWRKPCSEGPNPDGTCPHSDAPCRPTTTLRVLRGRLTLLAAVSAAALLALLYPRAGAKEDKTNSLDPGPLSASHARFVGQGSCQACHAPHPQGMSQNCLSCHAFKGEPRMAHNTAFPGRKDKDELSCNRCHQEHHGGGLASSGLSDAQCQSCHKTTFKSFAKGHPDFPEGFPKPAKVALRFNHWGHFNVHFKDPAFKAKAPKDCKACHDLAAAARSVPPMGFDQACSACHAGQTRGDLLVMTNDASEPALVQKFLFGAKPPAELDLATLGKAIEAKARRPAAPFLAGLKDPKLKKPKADAEPTAGWYWNEDMALELRYRPVGHADPVARAWLELAAKPGAEDLKKKLFSETEGLGGCAKCHAPGGWLASEARGSVFRRFSHAPHLRLMDCKSCHDLKAGRAGAEEALRPASDFAGLAKKSCASCHGEGMVRQDCRLCHFFHREPTLTAPARETAETLRASGR